MDKKTKRIFEIFFRYAVLLLVAIPNLFLFYIVFTPLTIYPVYFFLNLLFECNLSQNLITISECFPIEISKACVAGSAYFLLLILNLSTPEIKLKKRLTILTLAFLSLLILNIIRIFILSWLFINNSQWFDATHKLFWYALSTFFVIGIWFAEIKLFKIKNIPFYSDLKFLKNLKK